MKICVDMEWDTILSCTSEDHATESVLFPQPIFLPCVSELADVLRTIGCDVAEEQAVSSL